MLLQKRQSLQDNQIGVVIYNTFGLVEVECTPLLQRSNNSPKIIHITYSCQRNFRKWLFNYLKTCDIIVLEPAYVILAHNLNLKPKTTVEMNETQIYMNFFITKLL